MPHYAENDSEGRHSYIPVESNFGEDGHGASNVHIASLAEKKRIWWRTAIINACFIASWFIFATVLSLYNKWMFSPDLFGFPFPLFVTTLHMFVQFVLAAALRVCFSHHFRPERSPSIKDYGLFEARKQFLLPLLPVSILGYQTYHSRPLLYHFTQCASHLHSSSYYPLHFSSVWKCFRCDS